MEVEIVPQPSPEERAAIVAALQALAAEEGHACPGLWWRQGIRESLGEEEAG